MKKILVVDDSALMRRIICDIIESDSRFQVVEVAVNGEEALKLLLKNEYDAVVMDVNMPKLTGIQVLQELNRNRRPAKVIMVSTTTREGAKTTMEALALGAIDFVHKPSSIQSTKEEDFQTELLRILSATAMAPVPRVSSVSLSGRTRARSLTAATPEKLLVIPEPGKVKGNKIVAIASSTGGPKALQSVIPKLPSNLAAPVVIVQHMPVGFTESLAERLNTLSKLKVKEAAEGETLQAGTVYISRGGSHLYIQRQGQRAIVRYGQEPVREGVRPCANYMYESLTDHSYDQVVCVVMTGMGADGTVGIKNLKAKKNVHVIAQSEESCVVYGMPRAVVKAKLANETVNLENIAQEIITNVGVR